MKFIFLSTACLFFSVFSYADFDHSHKRWSHILKDHTVKEGHQVYFKYKKLKENRDRLNLYLRQLESVKKESFEKFTQNQKLAFWINAYNSYTVSIILKNYPLESIKDIKSGWMSLSSGPWKKDFIELLGDKMSLDDIEHQTIRKNFDEPRIHFAVNCASLSCPSLFQTAFVGEKIEKQLESASQNFLLNKSKNYLNGDTLYISKIFKWYGSDFDKKYGGFKPYIVKSLKLPEGEYSVEYIDYDWSLNEQKSN